jgi:uncharacterized protein
VKESPIHGMGCFSRYDVKKGEIVWAYVEGFDTESPKNLSDYPDDARFINHSDNPNTIANADGATFAVRDIEVGEEITENYCQTVPELAAQPPADAKEG